MMSKPSAIYLALAGSLIVALGCIAYGFFSPSPHGYGELFIAIPLGAIGFGILGVAFGLGPFPRAVRIIGWLALAIASVPIIALVWLVLRARVSLF
jgi:hypothetical protein